MRSGLSAFVVTLALGSSIAEAQRLRSPAGSAADLESTPSVESVARRASPVLGGLAVGVASGAVAGLLFAHDACDQDPCSSGAYAVAAAGGASLLGAMGAWIGSRMRGHNRRVARF